VVKDFRKELSKPEFKKLKQIQGNMNSLDSGSDGYRTLLIRQQYVVKGIIARMNKDFTDYDWDAWLVWNCSSCD
jgi:hypothetical protein